MGHHITIEVNIHFCSTEDHNIHHAGKVPFRVVVIGIKHRIRNMVRIIFDGVDSIKVKGLCIEDVFHGTIFHHIHHIACGATKTEAAFPAFFLKDLMGIPSNGQGGTTGTGLHKATVVEHSCYLHHFGC